MKGTKTDMLNTIEEATQVAKDTYDNIEFNGREKADSLLFQFLGQTLTTLKEHITKLKDVDTPK